MTACTIQTGGRACGSTRQVRHYLTGHACPDHTPAKTAGRPETQPDPQLTLDALQARFEHRPVTPDTRPRMGRYGVEVERVRLAGGGDTHAKRIPPKVTPEPAADLGQALPQLTCPGCHLHPRAHAPNCPMGPRARFAMAADGSILGTVKRGPE